MRRKKSEGSDAPAGGRITPADVQQVEFRLAFRGYNERDVDAFLDRITEDLSAYMEENQRLRAGTAGAPTASADLAAARSEAERIVAEARQEAARIVRDAGARATVGGIGEGDARAAVAPFLSSEREFLQSLGALVQGHAEEVKRMVAGLRSAAETASPAVQAASSAETSEPPSAAASEPEQEPAAASAPETEAGSDASGEPEPTTEEEAFAPISVPPAEGAEADADEPVPEPAQVQLRRDSGERSLRELFWGED
jgi:DivIVA domain-containing protein